MRQVSDRDTPEMVADVLRPLSGKALGAKARESLIRSIIERIIGAGDRALRASPSPQSGAALWSTQRHS